MAQTPVRRRFRKSFGKIQQIAEIPNLIDIQKQSYEHFLQKDVPPTSGRTIGLQGVFNGVFPIRDFSETSSLEFVSYSFGEPKYDVDECLPAGHDLRGARSRSPSGWSSTTSTRRPAAQSIRDIKEQEVYFGEIPLMTDNGTFIINGTERVIVSQLHRSPGRLLRPRQGQDPLQRQAPLLGARHPATAAPGSTSSSTPRTSSTCASTGAASCPVTAAAQGPRHTHRGAAQLLLPHRDASTSTAARSLEHRRARPARRAARAPVDIVDPATRRGHRQEGPQVHQARAIEQAGELPASRRCPSTLDELIGQRAGPRRRRPGHRRGLARVQRGAHRGEARRAARTKGIKRVQGPLHRRPQRRLRPCATRCSLDKIDTPEEAIIEIYRRLRPGEPADPRDGHRRSSTTCSSTPSATTSPRSAA